MSRHSTSTRATSTHSPKLESVQTGSTSTKETKPRHRPPRSLPPWIDSFEVGEEPDERLHLLQTPAAPTPAAAPTHNGTPSEAPRRMSRDGYIDNSHDPLAHRARQSRVRLPYFITRRTAASKGRKWDHLRTAEPVIVPSFIPFSVPSTTPTWTDFIDSSRYGRGESQRASSDPDILNKLQPHFNEDVDIKAGGRRPRRRSWSKRLSDMVLRHSYSPLAFRATVLMLSVISLGMAGHILSVSKHWPYPPTGDNDQDDEVARSQSLFVLIVDVLAMPYILYMLYDEYTGKPLGLRSTVQKTWMVLLDLIFIIFKASSTALVIETLVLNDDDSRWGGIIGSRFNALAGLTVFGLMIWTVTFIVNVFRMVERLGGVGEDENMNEWV